MTSLRRQLYVVLLVPVVLASSVAALWSSVVTQRELTDALDGRMISLAQGLQAMAANGNFAAPGTSPLVQQVPYQEPGSGGNDRIVWQHWQIWSLSGRLIARAGGTPTWPLTTQQNGFVDQQTADQAWRVYA